STTRRLPTSPPFPYTTLFRSTLRFDGGIRWEQMKARGAQEGQKTVNLGDPTTLADDNVLTGNGVFTNFDRKFHDIGYTAGIDWRSEEHTSELQSRRDLVCRLL